MIGHLLTRLRFFYLVLLPGAAVVALLAWAGYRPLLARETEIDAALVRAEAALNAAGIGTDLSRLEERATGLEAEAAELAMVAAAGRGLDRDPLVRDRAGQAFQLIEFEQERAAIDQRLSRDAQAAGVRLEGEGLGLLAEASLGPVAPRRLWAQLAMARRLTSAAVASRVETCALVRLPPPREVKLRAEGPVVVEEIALEVRVTGSGDRVLRFVEEVIRPAVQADDAPALLLGRVVLRKEGQQPPDRASVTVQAIGLLSPAP